MRPQASRHYALFISLLLCAAVPLAPSLGNAQERPYAISYTPGTLFHQLVRDRVKAVYDRAGIPVEFVALPHKRSISAADHGDVDGEAGRVPAIEKEAPNLVRVNVKLIELTGAAYVLGKSHTSYSEDMLDSLKVGMIRGIQWSQVVMKGRHSEQVNGYQDLLEMLHLKRIDLALAATASANFVLNQHPIRFHDIHRLEPPIFRAPIYHYVNKRNAHLVPRLEKALRELREENHWGDE